MATDFSSLRKWNASLESPEDKVALTLIPHGGKLVTALQGNISRNILKGIMSPEDANDDGKIASYLASRGYAAEALKKIYALTDEQIRANSQAVKGTTSR